MAFGRLIRRNALRNKRRTGLTVLSIAFSLFLLLTLLTFRNQLLNPVTNVESALRLIVSPATSLADMLPMAYLDRMKQVPGVTEVASLQWFNGVYKDTSFQFANFATDPRTIFQCYTEQKVDPDQKAAFIAQKDATVVTEGLARRFGWKVGDRITLLGTIFPVDLELTIVGLFTDPYSQEMLYFQFDYFNEALGRPNLCGAFVVKGGDPESVPGIAVAIDGMFRNSPHETKTETEKAFVLGFVSMLGNIQTIIFLVLAVVVFTMVLVSVSTMAMTVRERLREVAIFKTLGMPSRTVMALLVAEAVAISMSGAVLGLLLGESLKFMDLNKATQGFITQFSPGPGIYAAVLATGLAIGLISGYFPARQAVRLTITTAMRRLD